MYLKFDRVDIESLPTMAGIDRHVCSDTAGRLEVKAADISPQSFGFQNA